MGGRLNDWRRNVRRSAFDVPRSAFRVNDRLSLELLFGYFSAKDKAKNSGDDDRIYKGLECSVGIAVYLR